jgi:hypothetical protein
MKIKDLKWVPWESVFGQGFYCQIPFGEYSIEPAPEDSPWDCPYIWGFNGGYHGAESIEDAKKQANKDFQSSVLGCLDLT